MTKLFIELQLDQDADVLIADLLRAKTFFASTARDDNLLGADDPAQLNYAISRERAFFTHNRDDFVKLNTDYLMAGRTHYGIIIAKRRAPYEIVRCLLDEILERSVADEIINQIRFI